MKHLCSPDLLMANKFFMNEIPLPVLHFVCFDLLPLVFNVEKVSRKVSRIFVISVLRKGKPKVHMCVCTCMYVCMCMYCMHTYSMTCKCVYVCVLICMWICPHLYEHGFTYTLHIVVLYCTLQVDWTLEALRMSSRK
jgi:hypothetical protein